jgi:hypothetical protein
MKICVDILLLSDTALNQVKSLGGVIKNYTVLSAVEAILMLWYRVFLCQLIFSEVLQFCKSTGNAVLFKMRAL